MDVTLRSQEAKDAFKAEEVDGVYLWAQLYHLLRCGYPAEASALLDSHRETFRGDDAALVGAFKASLISPDGRVPKGDLHNLISVFNSSIRSSNVDQFKLALYKIIGRQDLSRKTLKVASTTEDWMWVQLSLVRDSVAGDGPQDQYDLGDLGRLVLKYGADKFDEGGKRPFAWFNLLLYTAQFERVSHCSRISASIADTHRRWRIFGQNRLCVQTPYISVSPCHIMASCVCLPKAMTPNCVSH